MKRITSVSGIQLFFIKCIHCIMKKKYDSTKRNLQSKPNLVTCQTRNHVNLTQTNIIQLRYRSIAFFLLLLFILFFAYSCLSPNGEQLPHSYQTNTNMKPLRRLSKSSLFHVHGDIKRLGTASPIYFINLPSRSDRRIRSIALAQILHFDAFIVPAYSIDSPEVVSRAHLMRPKRHSCDVHSLTMFELACWASHMQVWLEIAASKNNDTWSIVFEDDIDLEMATAEVMESFPHDLWNKSGILYLGHCYNSPGSMMYEGAYGYRVHQAVNPICTHAYAIRADAARNLAHLLVKPYLPIDLEIASQVHARKISAFSIHPPLALQLTASSLNPSNVQIEEKKGFVNKIRYWLCLLSRWGANSQELNKLHNSALARIYFDKAVTRIMQYEK